MRQSFVLGLALVVHLGAASADPAGGSITITSGAGGNIDPGTVQAPLDLGAFNSSLTVTGQGIVPVTDPMSAAVASAPSRPAGIAPTPTERLSPVAPAIAIEGIGVKLPDDTFTISEAALPAAPASAKGRPKARRRHP